MIWLLTISLLAYGWVVLRRLVAWVKMPGDAVLPDGYSPITKISVIIPVRNEEANIVALLQDLEAQQYPKSLYEVIVVDDHSTDTTPNLIQDYKLRSSLDLTVTALDDAGVTMKKAAVKLGVEQAKGELLVFTDGDCRVGPEWLQLYAYTFETEKPYFISGPVCFHDTHTLFERMQLVEFASLIGIGGASLALNRPNMCNGANLAYTKAVFEQVGGFYGNDGLASGDDEFLLHKVHKDFPGKAVFLKNAKSVVYTDARKSLDSFVSQRVRWASKWRSYQSLNVQLVALVVFLVNFLLFLSVPLLLFGQLPVLVFVGAYIAKFAIDFLFLERILSFLNKRSYIWHMLPLQLVYVPYVVFTGLGGLFGRYQWKGRSIRNA